MLSGMGAIASALSLFSLAANADFRDGTNPSAPAGIWPEITFVPAGDFKNFTETISQSRDQVRQMLWKEFSELLIPLVMAGADAEKLAGKLAGILLTFDQMHEAHKAEANRGIPRSLESIFRAEFDELFGRYGISDANRRAEFVRNMAPVNSLHGLTRSGATRVPQTLANKLFATVDFFMYGAYTILPRGQVEITVTVEKYQTGQTRSMSARGNIDDAIKRLARKAFDFFQGNHYADWVNPQPHLEWIPASRAQPRALAASARLYCRGQRARMPYARELVMASQGSNYASGGISPMQDHEIYVVADRQRWDRQHYFFVGREDATGGLVRTDAGQGAIIANYWCVRGDPGEEVRFIEDLYRLFRKNPDSEIRGAVEYILTQLEDYGARSEERNRFSDLDQALGLLETKGIQVRVPRSMQIGVY